MADKSWDDQYISKTDAIKLAIISIVPFANADNINGIQNSFEKTIGDFPSEDVQPVVHGEWIPNGDPDSNGNALYKCSICHFGDEHAVHVEVPYCWHCGARMDGGT